MIKLFGASLVILATVAVVILYVRQQRSRVLQNEGFLLLVRYLRGQILCYSLPMDEVLCTYENESLEACGFLPILRQDGLREALFRCEGRLLVTREVLRVLYAFADGVGKSYREEEITLCDYTLSELERAVHAVREEYPRRVRLGRSLAISGGLALVLILL